MSTAAAAPPELSHRERKKLATRRAIHDAAFDLVDANGLSHTTVEAISERAGVAPRTFWAYYASKEDAVLDQDPDLPGELRQALIEWPAGDDPVAALCGALEAHLTGRVIDSGKAIRRQTMIRREPQLMAAVAAGYDEMARAMVDAVAQRMGVDPASDMRPDLMVMAACGAARVALHHWADQGGARPYGDMVAQAFAELADGLAPFVMERRGR